jgi:hypothetical protein
MFGNSLEKRLRQGAGKAAQALIVEAKKGGAIDRPGSAG